MSSWLWYLVFIVIIETRVSLLNSNTHWCLYSSNYILFIPRTHKCVGEVTEEERGRSKIKRGQRIKHGHESCWTRNQEPTCWRGPAAIWQSVRSYKLYKYQAIRRHVSHENHLQSISICMSKWHHQLAVKKIRKIKSSPQINLALPSMRAYNCREASATRPNTKSFHWLFVNQKMRIIAITAAAPSRAWNVFARSNTGIVGSNPPWGMDFCLRLFCVCVVLCR
jgi:hypothetical protein